MPLSDSSDTPKSSELVFVWRLFFFVLYNELKPVAKRNDETPNTRPCFVLFMIRVSASCVRHLFTTNPSNAPLNTQHTPQSQWNCFVP
mmetsp:Transcript_34976/g.73387  ORF Transcript_34976/g.73387 Transcript_34976/m.73387 type:complete len:88 (-) Transcript_34976:2251-2514(-)